VSKTSREPNGSCCNSFVQRHSKLSLSAATYQQEAMKMKYFLHKTKKFRQDLQRAEKRNENLRELYQVTSLIQQGVRLTTEYRNHRLWQSEYKDCFECHICPDFLLVYRFCGDCLKLIRCGSHADLF
jgi:mRNA interferase YafQ